jgi:hypothetical protein
MSKAVLSVLGLLSLLVTLRAQGQAPVQVLVYPGTELVEVVQLLTDTIPHARSTYNQEVLTYFQAYRNHPAVQEARRLRRRGQLSCDFPVRVSWALYHFPDVQLAAMTNMEGYEQYFDLAQTQAFLQLCVRFAQDTHFWSFFQAHAAEYESWIADFNRGLYQDRQLAKLDAFYRVKRSKEVVITLGALNCATYAVSDLRGINPTQAGKSVIMVGYLQVARNSDTLTQRPTFYAPAMTSQLIWHEIGHAYLAQTFARNQPQVASMAYVIEQDSVLRRYAAQSGGAASYLQENVTQAVASLLKIRTGLAKREAELALTSDFYLLAPDLLAIIEREYYGQPRYRNFDAFFSHLLAELAKKHPRLPRRTP